MKINYRALRNGLAGLSVVGGLGAAICLAGTSVATQFLMPLAGYRTDGIRQRFLPSKVLVDTPKYNVVVFDTDRDGIFDEQVATSYNTAGRKTSESRESDDWLDARGKRIKCTTHFDSDDHITATWIDSSYEEKIYTSVDKEGLEWEDSSTVIQKTGDGRPYKETRTVYDSTDIISYYEFELHGRDWILMKKIRREVGAGGIEHTVEDYSNPTEK